MISFEIIQIAWLLSLVIILIAPFYMVWRKKVKITGRILMSLIILFSLVDLVFFIGTQVSNSYRRASYLNCIYNLNKELNSTRDDKALQSVLNNWLERKESTMNDLNMALFKLRPQEKSDSEWKNDSGDAIKYPSDEQEPYAKPVPHKLPAKGAEVDYSKIPGYAARVETERKDNNSYWKGNSVIVSGKIRLNDGAPLKNVAAHTSFLPGGVFAKSVYPGKSLNFVKSGYEPIFLYIDSNKRYSGKSLDMGELVMRKLSAEQQKQISFSLEGAEIADVYLITGWLPGVFDDDGYECAAPVEVCVEKRKVRRGEKVTFGDLSPVAYKLELSAPGYVEKTKYFTVKNENIDFGTITLSPSRKVVFQQRPFADPNTPWEETALEINGKTRLVVAPKDELGNNVAMSLKPDINSDKILAKFSWAIPEWYDYGVISPDKLNGKLPQPKKSQREKFLEEGHLYRFISDMKKVDKLIYLPASSLRSIH